VKGVSAPADYAKVNPLVPVNETQAAFELAIQTLIADGSFDAAVAAAEAFRAVAVAGRDREKRAEAMTAWAVSVPQGSPQAKEKFTAAADEYVSLVEVRPAETDKADLLRRAAGLYRQAGNPAGALATLERILGLQGLPDEVAGPVWVEYADSLLAANRPDDALKAFNGAMRRGGPASTSARYRVARLLIDSRDPRKVPLGVALLQQIAEAERVGPSEQEVHERALVELAHESIRAGKFPDAEVRLRMQLNRYPTGPEAGLGRLLLGICLLQRATPPKSGTPEPAKAAAWREEALELFKHIIKEAEAKKKAAGKGTERDDWLRLQASLRVLQAYQQMGKPYDVLTAAAPLLVEYRGTVDELIVRSLMYHAYKQLNQPENAIRMRDEMRAVFEKLKDQPGAFKVATGEYSREYWEKTWFSQ
jgi:tetratricopeptide (TPR) repeat protein